MSTQNSGVRAPEWYAQNQINIDTLIELAQEFCARVERGEIRSSYTYDTFKSVLARMGVQEDH